MKWVEPKHTKKAVARAGECLVRNPDDIDEESMSIIRNWRASHAYPLNSTQSSLRYRLQYIDSDGIVAQRLKRISSIKNKLQRFPSMKLSRMQDIGGCRGIVSSIKQVYELKDSILNQLDDVREKKRLHKRM